MTEPNREYQDPLLDALDDLWHAIVHALRIDRFTEWLIARTSR